MEGLGDTGRARKGMVFAWRRPRLGLAVLGLILCIVMTDVDLKNGAGGEDGASARLAQDDHETPVWSLAFAGSNRLASSTTAGEVRVRDLATGQVSRLQSGPGASALSLAFSPGSRILAVGGIGPAVRLWDTDTGTQHEPLTGGTKSVRSVTFAPDGRTLAVGSGNTAGQPPA